jgi:two-component system, NarL family, response regulator DevR
MISVAPATARRTAELSHTPTARTRVLAVDDHPAMREGLRELFVQEPDFELVAVCVSAEAAFEVAGRKPVDVAVVDYQLGRRNGLWLSRKLKRLPQPPAVLIYSAYTDGLLAAAAVVAEADSIISKATLGFELCDAIRSVASGRRHLPLIPQSIAENIRRRLGDQEQAIFGMLLAGIDPSEIGPMLGLSAAELESRLWEMLRALDASPAGHAA